MSPDKAQSGKWQEMVVALNKREPVRQSSGEGKPIEAATPRRGAHKGCRQQPGSSRVKKFDGTNELTLWPERRRQFVNLAQVTDSTYLRRI